MVMTMLHGKGLLMVMFVMYAENVSMTNAVTFWTRYQNWSSSFKNHHHQQQQQHTFEDAVQQAQELQRDNNNNNNNNNGGSSSSSSSSCANTSYKRSRVNNNHRTTTVDCCMDCTSCMEPQHVERLCDIRGGHLSSTAEAVAQTVVTAAASTTTPYNLPLNAWKIIFQFILTTINVVCWLVPLKNKKFSENQLGLSIANAFSGGVFLSLAFGHLLPECVHGFHGYNDAVPFMIALGGYLLIFFVEKVAFDTHAILDPHHGHAHAHADTTPQNNNGKTEKQSDNSKGSLIGGRSAILLLAALAVHSILEMTALGLADTFSDSALLSLSIALHQPAESIALLVAFLKSGMPERDIITCLSIFSLMGPIGVGVGMVVNEFAAPIVDSIMLAVVAGTFIYVGATEVIPEEWEDSEHKWKKFASLLTGIGSIFAITQYTSTLEGGHSH